MEPEDLGFNDVVTLSNGSQFVVEGFGALDPEQRDQRIAQLEASMQPGPTNYSAEEQRQTRIENAARGLREREDAMAMGSPGGLGDQIGATMNEFTRNYTGGLGDLAGAAILGIPGMRGENSPTSDLDFWERRDALRRSSDMWAERIPDWVDNTASLAGVLTMGQGPASLGIGSTKDAVKAGAMLGGIAGAGESDARSVGGMAGDTAVMAGAGGTVGGLADIMLSKIFGGAARGAFAREDGSSPAAYAAQREMGIDPSVGSIGNPVASGLENSFAQAPITSTVGRVVDRIPFIPGRSSSGVQTRQMDQAERMLQENVTDPMRPPAERGIQGRNDSDLAVALQDAGRQAEGRIASDVNRMETEFARDVPPNTPVDLGPVRSVPEQIRGRFESENMAQGAADELSGRFGNQPVYPIDQAKHATLSQQLGTIEGRIQQAQAQLRRFKNLDQPQPKALQKTIAKEEAARTKKLAEIEKNMGPSFAATRQERGKLGSGLKDGGGLDQRDSQLLYGPLTKQLEEAAGRVSPTGAEDFAAMTAKEKELYAQRGFNKKLGEPGTAANNVTMLKTAMLKGNDEGLSALLRNVPDEARPQLQADLIDSLGRPTSQEPFTVGQFATSWRKMSDPAKQQLFVGNPEGLAIAETIAEISEDMVRRGATRNHSNTAAAGSVMAGLGASIAAPGSVVPFLVTTLGIDRAVASQALASAVAGERTQIGQLMRQAISAKTRTEVGNKLEREYE